MASQLKWLLPLIVIGTAGAWYYFGHQASPQLAAPSSAANSVVSSAATSTIKYPIAATQAATPLPSLQDSDAPVMNSLRQSFGDTLISELIPTDVVRHIVAAVDALPRERLAPRIRPVRNAQGTFLVEGDNEDAVIAAENAQRYAPVIRLIQAVNMTQLVTWYRKFYPLFQQAYEGLGYGDGYFNDRLITVIDHLLDTPEPTAPLHLVRPNVMYQFADKELEARSSGQKILLRMGLENERAVKAKLRELRAALTQGANGA